MPSNVNVTLTPLELRATIEVLTEPRPYIVLDPHRQALSRAVVKLLTAQRTLTNTPEAT